MKYALMFCCMLWLLPACHDRDLTCADGEGDSFAVENQDARLFRDERFGTYVINHHVSGTIDAFRTYIICNVSEEWQVEEASQVIISGTATKIKDKDRPNVLIAGEEFFYIFVDDLEFKN